jgi:hypothetical protein
MSFSAGPERYAELVEQEGLIPAPYSAHHYWVALEHWNALEARELAARLADAHALTYAKLPKRTRNVLALPSAERRRVIDERRKALAAAKAAGPADSKADRLLSKSAKKPAKIEPGRRSTAQSEGRA